METSTLNLVEGAFVLCPAQGVGTVLGIGQENVAGEDFPLLRISFAEHRMVLKVPLARVPTSGIRAIMGSPEAETVMSVLAQKPRQSHAIWSRKARDYDTKINSGDAVLVAEVARDLGRHSVSDGDSETSIAERQIYERAVARLAQELSITWGTDRDTAATRIVSAVSANHVRRVAKAA